jgi:hypothetical protein
LRRIKEERDREAQR